MKLWRSVAGPVLGLGLLALTVPAMSGTAAAGPLGGAGKGLLPAQAGTGLALTDVQYRGGPRSDGGPYRGGPRRDYRGPRRDYHRGRGDDGAAAAAGIVGGLLLGAIIANEAQRQNSASYCAQRFRSYDPRSGTYLGRDGRRYRCP